MAKHVTVRWQGELDFDCTDQAGATVKMSPNPEAYTPSELLLAALAGCTGMDAASIMSKKKVEVEKYTVDATGEQREDHPRSFTSITVEHIVEGKQHRRCGRGPRGRALCRQVLRRGSHARLG